MSVDLELSDEAFDSVLPATLQRHSAVHWTPVVVARRAAQMLAPDADARVLDVGCGVGKFCLVGARTTPGEFTGVELRADLVSVAQSVALLQGTARVRFVHGDAVDLDWAQFNGFYFFNPFGETLFPPGDPDRIDLQHKPSRARFDHYAHAVEQKLAEAPLGTRVVTYHGFGGRIPDCYGLRMHEPAGTGALELWEKEPGRRPRVERDVPPHGVHRIR